MKYIYDLIATEQAAFQIGIPITDEWDWSFKDHVTTTVLYKNSIFKTGPSSAKPFKNILRPILNLQYRAEGFDVKDIVLYIEDKYKYFKSFLVRKYHEKWAREVGLDTFIDNMVESYVDFGGALVKKTKDSVPEVVPLQRIEFCDQSDMLSGPICEKHQYSPEELQEEAKLNGWDMDAVEDVIILSKEDRTVGDKGARKAKTPGKHIEVYELHGMFPRYCLYDEGKDGKYTGEYYDEDSKENELVRQLHICTFYSDKDGNKQYVTLYKGKEAQSPYKLVLRDEIYGRALGIGGGEELFQAQIWTNYGMIRVKQLLDAASKVLFKTTDPAFANRNKTDNLENGEILVVEDGKDVNQLDTTPRSTQLFDNFMTQWEAHARITGAATESILGESPSAGTPFKLQELITAESHSLHEYRKGKLATFLDEIYLDWIIPKISKEVSKGQEFLAELDLEELQQVAEALVICETNNMIKEKILNGEDVLPEEVEAFKQVVREEFMKGGNKKFIEILEGEMKDAPLSVRVNIAGKQKDLAGKVDKLTNIFRAIIANPAILQSPPIAKLFNQILESSGLSPLDFNGFTMPQPVQPQLQVPQQPVVNQVPQMAPIA